MPLRTDERRSMTAAGLARLLHRLNPEPDRAALEYERLRQALVRFFDWRGARTPEECADEAIDRLARRLEEGTLVESPHSYARGIATLVLFEHRREPRGDSLETLPDLPSVGPPPPEEDDRLRDCFDRCLDSMPIDSRSTVIQYYEGERHAKIANRRRLGASLGLSETALRSRVRRLRERLEHCVEACTTGRKETA